MSKHRIVMIMEDGLEKIYGVVSSGMLTMGMSDAIEQYPDARSIFHEPVRDFACEAMARTQDDWDMMD